MEVVGLEAVGAAMNIGDLELWQLACREAAGCRGWCGGLLGGKKNWRERHEGEERDRGEDAMRGHAKTALDCNIRIQGTNSSESVPKKEIPCINWVAFQFAS